MNTEKVTHQDNENLDLILKDFDKYKGQIVLFSPSNRIGRLVAICEDEFDYFYVVVNSKGLQLESCLSRIIQLKNRISNTDYNELVRIARLNDIDQTLNPDRLANAIKEWKSTFDETHTILTEFHWELDEAPKAITKKWLLENGFKDTGEGGLIKTVIEDSEFIRYIAIDNPEWDTNPDCPHCEVDIQQTKKHQLPDTLNDAGAFLTVVNYEHELEALYQGLSNKFLEL